MYLDLDTGVTNGGEKELSVVAGGVHSYYLQVFTSFLKKGKILKYYYCG